MEIVARYRITTIEVVIGIVGVLCLAELCRRSVGLPILCVAGALLVYALIWGSTNPSVWARITENVRVLFYSKEGILSTPVNVCSKYIVMFIIFGAFIVPYVFALNPAMLFIGTTSVWEVILICVTAFVGIFAVSAALEGYFLHHMRWHERILSVAGGLLLIDPGTVTDVFGLGLVAAAVVIQILTKKKTVLQA